MMVRRHIPKLFGFLNKEISSLHEAALLLGLSAFFSQLLALLRDRLLASTFGAGRTLDIYYAAFRIPDIVYVSIASFVSVTVLIPFIIGRMEKGEHDSAQDFMSAVFTIFFAVMIVVSAALYFLMPWLSRLVAPGFDAAAQLSLVRFSRIMLWSPILLGISNLLSSATQSLRNFFIYALSPILYNVGIILGVVLFYPFVGTTGLAWGVALGALLHLTIQLPNLAANGFIPRFWYRNLPWRELKQVVLISLPRTITLAAHQAALFVILATASTMAKGSIAVFNFAFNLQSVPLSIVGVSYSTAAFPTLAKLFSSGRRTEFLEHLSTAIRHIVFWSVPAAIMFIVLRAQIVRVILGAGHFDWANTRLTAACLALFAVSVLAQGLVLLYTRGYYAIGQTKIPLIFNTLSSLLNIVLQFALNYWFVAVPGFRLLVEDLLRVRGVEGTAVLMLPLAFTLGFIVNILLFWLYARRDFGRMPKVVGISFFESFLASLAAGFVAYFSLLILNDVVDINTFAGILTQGLVSGLLGLLVFALLLFGLRNEEIRELTDSLKRKFWTVTVVAPEAEEL